MAVGGVRSHRRRRARAASAVAGRLEGMCGRYATTKNKTDLLKEFDVDGQFADPELPASYNVAPTQTAAVVVQRHPETTRPANPCGSSATCAGVWCRHGRRTPRSGRG